MADLPPLRPVGPSASISAHFVEGVNGPRVPLLEAGHEVPNQSCLLLHSYTVLAYPWREVMPAIADGRHHRALL